MLLRVLSGASLFDGPTLDDFTKALSQAMAQIDHPNVLRVFDMGVHEGQDFIVMELAEGGSLAQWLEQEGPLPPAAAVHYCLQVLSALDAAHQSTARLAQARGLRHLFGHFINRHPNAPTRDEALAAQLVGHPHGLIDGNRKRDALEAP